MMSMTLKNLRSKISSGQTFLAGKLSRYESKLSIGQKKLLLVLFCFSFGLASIYIVGATITRRLSGTELRVSPIAIPYHIGKSFHQPGAAIDSGTYNRVERFKQFLDSLKANNIGRYSEIMNIRPHFYDSILAFESIYQLQLKK
jgi:hypothetical protein